MTEPSELKPWRRPWVTFNNDIGRWEVNQMVLEARHPFGDSVNWRTEDFATWREAMDAADQWMRGDLQAKP